ncbi:MAG: enoyl-CoA hydratase/isomerase family protein [Rhodococcus sp. (in: high G+C Gram-positive bacteria)]|uniref:enoyl-CoA hydratase/isomerase family protein n=1 Tax=Rhodococcus sp. TaxID=1831 RepID=UPI003BB1D4A1
MALNEYEGSKDDILLAIEDRIAWITFNRPETLNAFGPSQFHLLADLLDDVSVNPDVGVVVLTGNGRAFSAGGDVRGFTKKGLVDTGVYALRAITSIRSCRKPVIAMVNGIAVGGGNELVIASDLAIAARGARLGQAGTLIGACPVLGGTNVLPLQIGEKRAKQIVFFSDKVSAEQAFEWGWVNEVVDDEDLEKTTRQWAERLLTLHPQALQIAKANTVQLEGCAVSCRRAA